MSVRPLPHFAHSPIGKTTHAKGAAYDHVNYILRDAACSKAMGQNMPTDRQGARPYFEAEAYKDGVAKNARVADTFIIALPLELSAEQRHEAIQGFMDKIGKGRIAWLAAFHDMGKDEANPHCHLILRDADVETGRKVLGTTTSLKDVREAEAHGWRVPPRMTTADLRKSWCEHLNGEMERHGLEARFDARTLKEQGIDRTPQIHEGPKMQAMAEKDAQFFSQDRRRGDHVNPYSLLDQGSRAEHNERIREENRRKAENDNKGPQQSRLEKQQFQELRDRQREDRKAMYAEQTRDRDALREAQHAQSLEQQKWGRKLYAAERQKAYEATKATFEPKWAELRKADSAKERDQAATALKAEQRQAFLAEATKRIAEQRPVKDKAWQSLKHAQEIERRSLKEQHVREAGALTRQHISERLALQERWRDQHLKERAAWIAAGLDRAGMAPVQTRAVHEIKLRKAAENRPPAQAAEAHSARAKAERVQLHSLRQGLSAERQANQLRAGAPAEQRTKPGQLPVSRQRHSAEHLADQRQRSLRRSVAEGDAAAAQLQQKARSGATLSSAEKANASPEVKAEASRQEKTSRQLRFEQLIVEQQRQPGQGRTGGRSGR